MENVGWRGLTGRKEESATEGKDMEGERRLGAFGQGRLGREMGKYENGQKRLVLPIYITEKATMQASVIVIIVRHIRQ